MMEIDSGKNVLKRKNSKERSSVDRKSKKKESPTSSNVENIPRNNENSVDTPKSVTLLNYFSKLTPDQHQQQKHQQISKVTTKAEIHITDQTSVKKLNDSLKDEKLLNTKKRKSRLENCSPNFDEIEVLHSETITLSPVKVNINNILKSPTVREKPKWSFKIKLQSDQPHNEFLETAEIPNGIKEDFTVDSDKSSQKENVKEVKKIPKCLLPIKNKLNNSSVDLQSEREENCSPKIKVKKSKNESVLTENSKTDKLKDSQHGKDENSTLKSKNEAKISKKDAVLIKNSKNDKVNDLQPQKEDDSNSKSKNQMKDSKNDKLNDLQPKKEHSSNSKSKNEMKDSKKDAVSTEDSKSNKLNDSQPKKENNSKSKNNVKKLKSKSDPEKIEKPENTDKKLKNDSIATVNHNTEKSADPKDANDIDEDLIYDRRSRSQKRKVQQIEQILINEDSTSKSEKEVEITDDDSSDVPKKRGRPRRNVNETTHEPKNKKVKSSEGNKDSKVEKQNGQKTLDQHFKRNDSSETRKNFKIFDKVTSSKSIDVVTIDDDCETTGNSLKRKNSEKLAPIFLKKPKTVPTTTVDEAKQAFLKTEPNDGNNNKGPKKPIFSGPSYLPFPKIGHIQQSLTPDEKSSDFTFTVKCNSDFNHSFDLKKFENLNCKTDDVENNFYKLEKKEIEAGLKEIETNCEDAPALWKYISKISKQESNKPQRKSSRRSKGGKNKSNAMSDNPEIMTVHWTEKYRPNSTADVVGNEEAAAKLKTWLLSWKQKRGNENYSSGEEFYSSDGGSNQGSESNQVAVLTGPHGSGKTAAVYAIAEELGYKVLEVNASSKRPGKQILKQFAEATKSHRVKKTTNTVESMCLKKTSSENSKKTLQNSLILMEDIDVIFEEDEGFISACSQLATNSKRPIIFTLKNQCSHLIKAAPEQLQITFEPAGGKRVNALLQLIVLGETGCLLPEKCTNIISQGGDLRRSLLQLQYLCLPKKEDISLSSLSPNKSLSDMGTRIYKSAIKSEKKTKEPSNATHIADSIDGVSLLAFLNAKRSTEISADDMIVEPSMSMLENMHYYDTLDSLGHEIQNWIEDATCPKSMEMKKIKESAQNAYLFAKEQVAKNVNFALSHVPSHTLDRYALSVDYLPSIRTICRSEELRFKLNSKRGNRFFHYFQGTGLPRGIINSNNVLMSACKMLREDVPENIE